MKAKINNKENKLKKKNETLSHKKEKFKTIK